MKRVSAFLAVLLALLGLTSPLLAQIISGPGAKFDFFDVYMRNSNSTPNSGIWTGAISNTPGYLDSLVFRRASAAYTVLDTTQAFFVSELPWPPYLQYKAGTTMLTDTTAASPWISVRVRQDTTSYSYSSNSVMDSIHFCAQWSVDGINWNSITGTPTKEPSATFFPTAGDGLISLGVKVAEHGIGASDVAQYDIDCQPTLFESVSTAAAGTYILNRTMCRCPGYIRFIIGGDLVGQWKVQLGKWIYNN